ncbi:MAG: NAD(P) transhydrogenase subunit alpha [Glaciecola sp.]|jgi:NAD(P) transhydrogenase subunit alpha|uniref:NAD(P) transhydrogenase subunit alpha n=1 Tax=Glaciecola sp. HTCC2999 TaxID=455436 RepID=UPI0000E0EEB3|nr:NAD(P) transhydrogenase subunit alpha [Glaciecola sp. HTCC2999]MCH1414717.1 NAD(P) transhydrogenase subunit alpha [Glaciecola sp.]
MTTIAFPKEIKQDEKRCALMPSNIKAYTLLGLDIVVESGLGDHIFISDDAYEAAGAIVTSRESILAAGDFVITVNKLPLADVKLCKSQACLISFLDPFNELDYLTALSDSGQTSISVEMIPRSSRCQKMDALSSQASLAGYSMVSIGMQQLNTILPMMMTPSGTIKSAKVFVIGAGVAGLQAIATAKRLGATVTAFDTREVVAEQVKSLGGKFLEIDLGQTAQTEQGYATELTPEQMAKQQAAQEACIADSDIVITTAQLFGRKPPKLISKETVGKMKPGSVIVDMAAENGGNVEGTVAGKTVLKQNVYLVGNGNWPCMVAKDASQMYANNMLNLISEFADKETNTVNLDLTDDILQSCVITHAGNIVNPVIRKHHNIDLEKTV